MKAISVFSLKHLYPASSIPTVSALQRPTPLLKMRSNDTHPGVLHRIQRPQPSPNSDEFPPPPLVAFEHLPYSQHLNQSPDRNTLIFLGGLYDGLFTVPYVPPIVSALPLSWSLVEPTLSSYYRQWGFSSLGADVKEISLVVKHFRYVRPQGNIVLMGHSTGSQQIIHYLLSEPQFALIDGGICQAGASDREAMGMWISPSEYESGCKMAQSYVDDGREDDILPFSVTKSSFTSAPISARRWLSMASPGPAHAGEDDYFSSDFEDERLDKTFGRVGKAGARLSFLYSGQDQYVPGTVDKAKLVESWHKHVKKGGGTIDQGSGVVDGASHTLKEGGKGLEDLVARVNGFLKRLDSA